jgi:hypothetical protein
MVMRAPLAPRTADRNHLNLSDELLLKSASDARPLLPVLGAGARGMRAAPRTARKAPLSTTHLPAAIVAATSALAVEVSAWADTHPDCTLTDRETAVQAAGRRALAAVLHGALLATQRTLAATPVRCPGCGHVALRWDWRQRSLLTTCGRLCWHRPWAHCPIVTRASAPAMPR